MIDARGYYILQQEPPPHLESLDRLHQIIQSPERTEIVPEPTRPVPDLETAMDFDDYGFSEYILDFIDLLETKKVLSA